ncbi:hypothetical protein AB0D63_42665 [Kitasatospora sp. NPDC048343]|uniref:hypothetical protein n=1 Tax=Kitasatospora sp. NPDC048343 TaxID=3154717 RepID=UPI0033D74B4A
MAFRAAGADDQVEVVLQGGAGRVGPDQGDLQGVAGVGDGDVETAFLVLLQLRLVDEARPAARRVARLAAGPLAVAREG